MKEKALDFLKKNYILIICAACVVIALAALITALASGGNKTSDGSSQVYSAEWGRGLTEGIPEFPEKAVSMTATAVSTAAYYENVSGGQITEYLQLLERECGLVFSGESFPRSAICGEKIVTVHYNATEKRFSVTVAAADNSN